LIQIVIAEDHLVVRAGIRALLEKTPGFKIVGEASNGVEAVELTEKLTPDILVMDIMMPRMNGIQAAELLRSRTPKTKILLLSMYTDEALVYQALQSGVNGYVLKSSASDELEMAIREVADGGKFLSSTVSEIALESAYKPYPSIEERDLLTSLSPREKEIMQLVAEEHTSSEIAEILTISVKTVEKHRSNLMEKLHVRSLAGLVRLAVKFRLVDGD
jgi:DNA-binding NarL/FixJ family response regulator